MDYNICTLTNGLRVIHRASAAPVVYCGFGIAAGSRHEAPGDEGLAHFCEHVSFKGTERRRACHIINCLERVGGDLNAFTNKEDTFYYAAVLSDHLGKAVDLLADIVFHSTFPQPEIDKEVEIICDEIESYNDSPAELIYDEFENLVFARHPLGHNILGEADRVRRFVTADAQRFARQYYRPDNAVFFADGCIDFGRLIRMLCRAFDCAVAGRGSKRPDNMGDCNENGRQPTHQNAHKMEENSHFTVHEPQLIVHNRHTHQAHVMTGCRGYSAHDSRRIALFLLNNILGGPGMNSRLNTNLRERHGLVYTVESSMVSYGDTGLWGTYFGCDPHDVKRCLRLVRHELDRVCDHALSPTQLANAKRQLKGQIGISCDNRENFALDCGKSFLHYGWEKDVSRLYQRIDAVTAQQLQDVAQDILNPQHMTTLIYQ